MIDLRPFQKWFLKGALAPGIRRAALSLSRGNGKSTLAAFLLKRCLTPGDPLFRPGAEYLLLSGSLDLPRLVFNPLVAELDEREYRTQTSTTRLGVYHNDALDTALGKPDSDMKVIYIGTLAPATGGWWHDLVDAGSAGSVYVQALRGNPEKWNSWREIMRVNPLASVSPELRAKLREERAQAQGDTRLKARFLSYRLNVPTADTATMLLEAEDWERCMARPVAPRQGQPIVALDLGGGRAWSAAVALWETGRIEALALTPGITELPAQEKRDRVPAGTYRKLYDRGVLAVDEGRRVQSVEELWRMVVAAWGEPVLTLCDRFRLNELVDALGPYVPIEPRVTRWSEASYDIRALRKGVKDGPLTVAPDALGLLTVSLAASKIENDTGGNMRLIKRDRGSNTGRDDVAAALTLAAGAFERYPAAPADTEERRPVVVG